MSMESTKNKSVICSNCGGQIDVNTLEDNVKCPFCGTKYVVSDLLNESDAVRIEKIKANAQQKSEQERLKHEMEQSKTQQEKDEVADFKKSKFSKVLIIFAIFSVLLCAVAFNDGRILAGIVAVAITALLILAYLMKAHIVKENKKGMGTIVAIIAFLLFVPYFGLYNSAGSSDYKGKASQIDISSVELIDEFPVPDKLYGRIITDGKSTLSIELVDVTKQDYKDYVKKCTDYGYTLEQEDGSSLFSAFNEKGYEIRVSFYDYSKETTMSISLNAPEEMKEFEWPTNGLGTKVPKTKSNYGRICWDNSESFIVHVGKTSKSDYNEYVKECENNGYTLEHSKGDKTFSAKNAEGYTLHLMYLGGNVMEVSVKPSEKTSTNNTTTPQTTIPTETKPETPTSSNNNSSSTSSNNGGIRQDFKNAMDSYESFMNEYIDFMKKYAADPTDVSLISQYATVTKKYADQVDAFEKWESEDLNTAEMNYYIDVQSRVNKKLSEVQ